MAKEKEKVNDFVNKWMKEIDLGIRYKEKFSSLKDEEKYKKWYRGDWEEGVEVPVNRIFSNAKALIPRVYFRTPSVTVTPRRPEFALHARVVEALDNWLIQELDLKYTIKKATLDSFLSGMGPIKLGYDSEFGYFSSQGVDRDKSTISQVSTKTGNKIEYRQNVKSGMPWAIRTKPNEVITPYGIDTPNAFPWIAHTILRPLSDVKEDQKYINTSELKGGYVTAVNNAQKRLLKDIRDRMEDPYCLLYEIRDVKTGRIYVFSENKILLDEEDELQIDGLPWEFIIYNDDPDHFYGIPDVKLLAPQQKELNENKSQSSRMRKLSVLKFLYKRGVIRKEELEKLLSTNIEDIGAGIEVDSDSLMADINPLQPHNLTDELLRDQQAVEADMRETMGFGRNQLGEMSPFHGKTATEAQIVEKASEVRTDERRDLVADTLSNILRKWNQYIFKFWTGERVVEILGPEGKTAWITYTGEQLKGEYRIKIDPESGLPVSRGMRYQQSKELFELFNGDPLIDQHMLRKMVLQQFDWIDPTAALLVQEPSNTGMGGPGGPGGMGASEGAIPFEQMMTRMPKPIAMGEL